MYNRDSVSSGWASHSGHYWNMWAERWKEKSRGAYSKVTRTYTNDGHCPTSSSNPGKFRQPLLRPSVSSSVHRLEFPIVFRTTKIVACSELFWNSLCVWLREHGSFLLYTVDSTRHQDRLDHSILLSPLPDNICWMRTKHVKDKCCGLAMWPLADFTFSRPLSL